MKNLPTSADEDAMVSEVAGWVERVLEKMTTSASRDWLENTLRQYLHLGLVETMKVVAAAEAGDEIAHAALCRVGAEMLDRGVMPGAALRAYNERVLLREGQGVTRGAGRNKYDDWRRNIGIACLVYLTCRRFGLRPTRNRGQRHRGQSSGSSVVARALGRFRINVAEKRVENIWGGLHGQLAAFMTGLEESPSIPSI